MAKNNEVCPLCFSRNNKTLVMVKRQSQEEEIIPYLALLANTIDLPNCVIDPTNCDRPPCRFLQLCCSSHSTFLASSLVSNFPSYADCSKHSSPLSVCISVSSVLPALPSMTTLSPQSTSIRMRNNVLSPLRMRIYMTVRRVAPVCDHTYTRSHVLPWHNYSHLFPPAVTYPYHKDRK